MPTFYEFFAGGGMARAGLGPDWQCLFANDIDAKKASAYTDNWGRAEFKLGDIYSLKTSDLPERADLAWASFPCQDLSLAGAGAGLDGDRSGAFWGFWRIINNLRLKKRAPQLLVIENVVGALTSNGGKDFAAICRALSSLGYNFGAAVIDAALFLPHSRPRLFIIAHIKSAHTPLALSDVGPSDAWHPKSLQLAQEALAHDLRRHWIWWRLPLPDTHEQKLVDLIEEQPTGVSWHSAEQTSRLISQMSSFNCAKLKKAQARKTRVVGTIYKRTRRDENGKKVQRAEVRFDDIAGCLRTPAGGSSRQIIIVVEGSSVRSRLLSPREAARLMGLADTYKLPKNYNEAYHLAGDGVGVPVVRHLASHILSPIVSKNPLNTQIAAE
jgi:DNA (cytosine-5)-methyltransferase 1